MAGGRPTKYDPKYCEQARKLCLLGYTDAQLADFFEVAEQTINNWKNDHPEFLESLKRGKDLPDAEVAESLLTRAKGFSKHITKTVQDKEGNPVELTTEMYYPPDPTSMIYWLKNRQPKKWRDKPEIEKYVEEALRRYFEEPDGSKSTI